MAEREPRKRKPSEKLTSLDNIDRDVLKKRKSIPRPLSQHASVKVDDDDGQKSTYTSLQPQDAHNILEPMNDDDGDVVVLEQDPKSPPAVRCVSVDSNEESNSQGQPKEHTMTTITSQDRKDLEAAQKQWRSPIYAFFHPEIEIENVKGRIAYVFRCSAVHCKHKGSRDVKRFLDTGDKQSTSNLRQHARNCWGDEIVKSADGCGNVNLAREGLKSVQLKNGSLTAVFQHTGKGKISYSHCQHTRSETRAEIVKWVAKSMRPFSIVEDEGFKVLMKTGRPEYYLPGRHTVARDVKHIFVKTKDWVSKLPLKNHQGLLSFGTDAWTSPNNKAYVAVTVHFEQEGIPISLLLDIVEVPHSHSGLNLATAFASILEDYGVEGKILSITCDNASCNDTMINELAKLVTAFPGATNRTRCFAHILNLVARCILKQFNLPKAKWTDDEATRALNDLAGDIEHEEAEMDDEGGEIDNEDGMLDVYAGMSESEIEELEENARPVRVVLVKLRKLAYTVKNSTTIILPKWKALLESHQENHS